MKKRIFITTCAIALASVLLTAGAVMALLYSMMDDDALERLQKEATYVAAGIEEDGASYLERAALGADRVTWVDAEGNVLFDTEADPAEMENHKDRPEIQAALQNGAGQSERLSSTLSQKTFYYALRLQDGSVLRMAGTAATAFAAILRFIPYLIVICILIVVMAGFLARWQTKSIISPLNQLDLEHPLENDAYPEISPLLRRISHQTEEIREQVRQLETKKEEFSTVSENLNEGLVLLSLQGNVLSLNQSARKILQIEQDVALPQHLLALNRSLELEDIANKAAHGQRQEIVWNAQSRSYRVTASPVMQEGVIGGVAMLMIDETEALQAEAMRREFTANVSHELKTPLTSISGYAEIMCNGLVPPENMKKFAASIHDEASRLIVLIEDIMQLSRLDEKDSSMQWETVELFDLAKQVMQRLEPKAAEAKVKVGVQGTPAAIWGVRAVLDEIMFNLCDNAIKYNKPNGKVTLRVEKDPDAVRIVVKDTGIGIPAGEQARVFERFYRVDKSHSKQTGGTGLGLSIVKHGVQLHKGTVQIFSSGAEGTIVEVTFPT
ncbi:MAG: ATP-binding protein [Oscillospiraceae bacterium]